MTHNEAVVTRRDFLGRAAVGAALLAGGAVALGVHARPAQAMRMPMKMPMRQQDATQGKTAAGAGQIDMDGDYYKAVRRAPKPNATPLLSDKQIDEFERQLACPCPCTQDVFSCRTTDFTCGNSPAVHRDVQALVAGGYSADEIMQAMLSVYGNEILMAPPKKGLNLIAWFAPFVALGAGAVAISIVLSGWRRNAKLAAANAAANSVARIPDVEATDEEMDRLRAALRDDSR
ncbi:MAG: cytochrome c-type biogenesis protein CcmH [Gemmatimonadaceae bacterium]